MPYHTRQRCGAQIGGDETYASVLRTLSILVKMELRLDQWRRDIVEDWNAGSLQVTSPSQFLSRSAMHQSAT